MSTDYDTIINEVYEYYAGGNKNSSNIPENVKKFIEFIDPLIGKYSKLFKIYKNFAKYTLSYYYKKFYKLIESLPDEIVDDMKRQITNEILKNPGKNVDEILYDVVQNEIKKLEKYKKRNKNIENKEGKSNKPNRRLGNKLGNEKDNQTQRSKGSNQESEKGTEENNAQELEESKEGKSSKEMKHDNKKKLSQQANEESSGESEKANSENKNGNQTQQSSEEPNEKSSEGIEEGSIQGLEELSSGNENNNQTQQGSEESSGESEESSSENENNTQAQQGSEEESIKESEESSQESENSNQARQGGEESSGKSNEGIEENDTQGQRLEETTEGKSNGQEEMNNGQPTQSQSTENMGNSGQQEGGTKGENREESLESQQTIPEEESNSFTHGSSAPFNNVDINSILNTLIALRNTITELKNTRSPNPFDIDYNQINGVDETLDLKKIEVFFDTTNRVLKMLKDMRISEKEQNDILEKLAKNYNMYRILGEIATKYKELLSYIKNKKGETSVETRNGQGKVDSETIGDDLVRLIRREYAKIANPLERNLFLARYVTNELSIHKGEEKRQGNFLFVVDTSGSMGVSKLATALAIPLIIYKKYGGDRDVFIETFSDNPSPIFDIHDIAKIIRTMVHGGTDIDKAVLYAISNIEKPDKKYDQKIRKSLRNIRTIILITDGEDNIPDFIAKQINSLKRKNKIELLCYGIELGETGLKTLSSICDEVYSVKPDDFGKLILNRIVS